MSQVSFGAQTEDELRFSPVIVNVSLAVVAFMCVLASDRLIDSQARMRLLFLGLVCYLALGLLYLLPRRFPATTTWAGALIPALLIPFSVVWLDLPGLVALLPIPVVLAMGLLGFRRVWVSAALESLALTLMAAIAPWLNGSMLVAGLAAIWGTWGLLLGLYQLITHLTEWSWSNYRQVLLLLEEARDRSAELEQVLRELVHVNRQMDLLNERLAATRLAAEEAKVAKANFVAKVSHEFRTPLNMIIGLTDLAVESPEIYGAPLPPSLVEDLRIVHRNCTHLASMINDVLDLSQTESGRLVLRREWVDLGAEIANAAAGVQPLMDKKGLALRVHCPPTLP